MANKCNKVFEVDAIDARKGRIQGYEYGLVVACNKTDAKKQMAKKMSVNKRFIDFKVKEATRKAYSKLPIKRGVY